MFHLFGVVSGTFQPSQARYDLLLVVPLFTSDEVKEINFFNAFISGTAFLNYNRGKWYYKIGQAIESRAIFITNYGKFSTRWDNN